MCEPAQCETVFSAVKSYVGMKVFSALWDNDYSHNWAADVLVKLLKDHNHGENGNKRLVSVSTLSFRTYVFLVWLIS